MLVKEYDLRGIFEKEITPELVKKTTKQFFKFTKKKNFLLAIDSNFRSLIIKNFLEKEFKNKFEFLGVLPTPIFYYFVINRKIPGIIITASHLGQKYVGLKFLLANGNSWKPKIIKIKQKEDKFNEKFPRTKKENLNKLIDHKLYKEYFLKLKNIVRPKKFIEINFDLSNFFLKTSLPYFKILRIKHSSKSPIIIKSDFDNDRIYIFYQKNKILADLIFFFLAKRKKYQRLGVPVYFSKYLEKELKNNQKDIFYIKTGHYYFKKAFKNLNLDLAFEISGHFYMFKDLKTEAPYLALSLFLHTLNLRQLKLYLQKIFLIRKNINLCEKIDLEKIINSLKEDFNLKLKKIDGYFLYKDNLFFHLRKSNTEEKIRLSLEKFI